MNQQHSKSTNHATSFPRMRSIGVTIGSGLLLTGILFTAMSVIALLGFYSFQNVLHNFSEKTFPITAQEAQSSILTSQLLQQINLLQNADSQQKRRIAYENVTNQFSRIATFSSNHPESLKKEQQSKLDSMRESINTLNNQISTKLDLHNDLHSANTDLILQTHRVRKMLNTLLDAQPVTSARTNINLLEEQVFNLLVNSFNDKLQVSLFQLNQKFLKMSFLLRQMQSTLLKLPLELQVPTQPLLLSLQEALLGVNGKISLEKQYLIVKTDCENRILLIRNLLENEGDSSMTHFFDLTLSVANDSKLLSKKVYNQIQLLSALFVISLFMAIGYFFYFQRFLIKRLTGLNKTVLAMVAGENLQIEDKGNDEITEIAHSINYFSTELHEAKSIAEKSAIQKSEFLAHMSHEIRTPLNAILGFSDLALKTNSPQEHLDYLSKINNASHSLLGIINSVLDISKIEAGKFTFDKVEFDLRNLLEEISSIISLKCEESGLHFYFNIESNIPCKVIGDPLRLSQVLTNLVANAFKFTEEGNITIHISAKRRLANWKNKTTLLFSVQDTGDGISKEQAQHLFEPFTQADTSITRKFGGTGLGLAICKNLVEMMGGNIWLKQNETKGSTFSFTCTFELVGNDSFYDHPTQLDSMSAIVMSRIPQSATELSMQLRHFGFTIFQTLSIDEILAKVQQNAQEKKDITKEIIFIDCEDMPFHWQEVIQSIKGSMTEGNMSPLILTGSQRLSTHFHSQHKQTSDYFLINPVTPARLLDSITTVLDIDNPHCLQKQSLVSHTVNEFHSIHGGATVLLVEDNEINSQIAVAYLKSRNLAVIIAHNGAEALEILLASDLGQINVILMDIQMPVMDGYTATKAIRGFDSPLANIPIVALTAHAMSEEREKCLAAGMNAYITKPIDVNKLFQILAELIGEQSVKQLKQNKTSPHSNIPDNLLTKNSSLNMKNGLTQVMNDPALYMDLLMSFVKKYNTWPDAILTSFKIRDLKECRHLVHTLKGVSGNLGMEKLFSLCVRLELHIRGNEIEDVQRLLDEVKEETEVVCNFLNEWLKHNKNCQYHSDTSIKKLDGYNYNIDELTEALSTSLKNNSSKALKQIQLLKSQLGNDDSYVFNKIEQHAKELDFDKARKLLNEWQNPQ